MKFNSHKSFNQLKIIFLFTALLALIGCGGGGSTNSNSEQESNENASGDLTLVWSDEFDGDTLDSSKWNIETGYGPNNSGWGNDESQLYTNSSDNLKVENGNLVITARCRDSNACGKRDGSITSARINTKDKFEFRYGTVRARIKTPEGRSTWPAFWMLGANFPETNWPLVGEIDVMEMFQSFSNTRTTHSTLHWFDDTLPARSGTPGHQFFTQSRSFNEPLTNDFHVFETQWDENQIIGRIDGEMYFRRIIDPLTMDEFLKNFFLIMNVAVDGTLGGEPDQIRTTPQNMLVDWVRVYENSSDASNNPIPTSSFDSGLLVDGDFEGGTGSWTGTGANISFVNGNLVNSANVAVAGNAFDVNLGQRVPIIRGRTYLLSFRARTEDSRTLIAGIGLNESPFTNVARLTTLTPEWQTFEYTLSATSFGGDNSRVFFDMGADTGLVLIDDVSLIEVE